MKRYSQESLNRWFECMGKSESVKLVRGKTFDFIKTEKGAWPNKLFNLSISKENMEEVLEEIEKGTEKGILPKVLTCTEEDYQLILTSEKSNRYKKGGWSAMTHDLMSIGELPENPKFKIEQVENVGQLEDWKRVVEQELIKGQIQMDVLQTVQKHPNSRFYLGCIDGKAVATALLFGSENRSGIYLIATDGQYRKQGLGSLITNHCLIQAKSQGYECVDIEATTLGESVYKSLGFVRKETIRLFVINRG